MHFYEKLLILIVLFLGVTIGTASIIGMYVREQKANSTPSNRIILENINLYDFSSGITISSN